MNWTLLSGSFIADSNYTYLAIGNYYNDVNTSTVITGSNTNRNAYYYVEDVCLSTDSLLCNSIVTSENNILLNEEMSFYPQPAKDFIIITLNRYSTKEIELKIFNITGKEIERRELEVNQGKVQFSTLHLPNGIYILQLKNSQGQVVVKRLVVSK